MNHKSKVLLYTGSLSGHRESYLKFAIKNFAGERTDIKKMLIDKRPVMFLMIEDSFMLYFCIAIFRSLTCRITIGLLFRPLPSITSSSLKLKIKRSLLHIMKRIKLITTLLIIPWYVNDKFEEISDGWIFDFQFWDISDENYKLFSQSKSKQLSNKIAETIDSISHPKKIVTAIGSQDRNKGFDIFLHLYNSNLIIRNNFLFIFGGKAKDEFNLEIDLFNKYGGYSLNRFISNSELQQLYASSDFIWALYSEEYNQASGIFGRALQYGIPVIVRENSIIHKISIQENIPHIALSKENILKGLQDKYLSINLKNGIYLRNKFKNHSLKVINNALRLNKDVK